MNGMTMKKFYNAMIEYNEIEFTYHDIEYTYSKNSIPNKPDFVEITIWSGEPSIACQIRIISSKDKSKLAEAVNNILNSPILLDGKTIREAEKEINVTVLFG